jgi:hypothetical protein
MALRPTVKALAWFSTGAIAIAVIGSIFTVFVLHWYDPKYQDALIAALQIQLMGLAILIAAAILVLGVVISLRAHGKSRLHANARVAWITGIAFPIGALILGPIMQGVDPESVVNPLVGWGYTIVYPLIAGFLISKSPQG